MSETNELSEPKDSSKAKSERDNEETTRRLLLYEVLLEEYETDCPPEEPEENEAGSTPDESGAESSGAVAAKKVTQPNLSKKKLDAIRKKGVEKRQQCESMGDAERELCEEEYNGQLAAEFFTLLASEQKKESERNIRKLRRDYEPRLKEIIPGSSGLELSEMLDRTVSSHVLGTLDDYREEDKRASAKAEEEDQDQDAQASNEEQGRRIDPAELRAFKSIIERPSSEPGESDPGNGNGNPGVNDSGDGRSGRSDSTGRARCAYARSLRSALCLSGGGIRSATFNLGILQGLARHGLLDQFDYLSTVSGGGFIGGWLTAWMHRQGTQNVIKGLTDPPPSPVEPEPAPINHLRVFSNYLSPRPGLLSADTWTLIATLLRNLMLTWLVFVPFLVAALMAPRAWMAIVSSQPQSNTVNGWTIWIFWMPLDWYFLIGTIAGWVALTFAGVDLAKQKKIPPPPNLDPYKSHDNRFLFSCLLPAVLSAAAFSLYWIRVSNQRYSWVAFTKFAIWLIVIPWVVTIIYRLRHPGPSGHKISPFKILLRVFLATVLIIAVQAVVGGLLQAVAANVFPRPADHLRLYATFSVPLPLAVLVLGCALIAGLTSTLTKDEDMEWWARAGAWFLIVSGGWVAANVLVLFGPSVILLLGSALRDLRDESFGDKEFLKALGQVLTVVGGVVSGVVTLLGGFSGKSAAGGKEARETGSTGRLLGWLTTMLGPIFLGFLIILLSLGTNWLLTSELLMPGALPRAANGEFKFPPSLHAAFVINTPLLLIASVAGLVLAVGTVMGLLINTNKFSLHFTWRDRIIRAYLGASREKRNPDEFTNFDTNDNLYMCELRQQPLGIGRPQVLENTKMLREECEVPPRKLFHVLNIALNLAGGDKLAWQDRKAESFTVSPLHSGNYWLGYRRSRAYGGYDGGISLGTAVAISGAFVSPNMGYMMTSPVVRFLMTLFNARFGWWLGNPGAAGDKSYWLESAVARLHQLFGGQRSGKPFESACPAHSVRPIADEAFGKTNDKSPYVYLSDGGHFENLGLYEMVLRRCRFIVVCDASTDAGYSFDSLAQSIRQIRVDLGVPIDIREVSITTPSHDLRGKYCAVGRIRYSCVDRSVADPAHAELDDQDFDGTLIYIKASMIGEEPRDVVNYGRGSQSFPQEVIVDQWFTEAQFESYRVLGSHMIDVICSVGLKDISSQNVVSLAAFERKARQHNQLNFRVFKERISYDALASEFRRTMRKHAPGGYKSRVRRYLDDLLG